MSLVGKWIDLICKVATGSWKMRFVLAPIVVVTVISISCVVNAICPTPGALE